MFQKHKRNFQHSISNVAPASFAMRNFILIVSTVCIALVSCSHLIVSNKQKYVAADLNTQKAIFEYLKTDPFLYVKLIGKGPAKLDPMVCVRETLRLNNKVYFSDSMRCDLLKYPLPKDTYQLVIPDSLAKGYCYTGKDEDYEHDYAIIYQFSPLLPTKEPNIFIMEHHLWSNDCSGSDDKFCCRTLFRFYLKFKIENQKIDYLDWFLAPHGSYFIGFGCFPRLIMEKALPGEKIPTFIW